MTHEFRVCSVKGFTQNPAGTLFAPCNTSFSFISKREATCVLAGSALSRKQKTGDKYHESARVLNPPDFKNTLYLFIYLYIYIKKFNFFPRVPNARWTYQNV